MNSGTNLVGLPINLCSMGFEKPSIGPQAHTKIYLGSHFNEIYSKLSSKSLFLSWSIPITGNDCQTDR